MALEFELTQADERRWLQGVVGEETKEAQIIWCRPWHDDVWIRNPFSGEAIVISKETLPLSLQAKINRSGSTENA